MAKRKKKGTTRRRRIGAAGKLNARNPLVAVAAVAAGYMLGDKVNEQVDKVAGGMDGKLIAGAEIGLGLVAMGMTPLYKKKTLPGVVVGGVLTGAGLKKGLSEFGVISGFHNVPAIAGYRRVPALNGYNPTPGQGLGSYNPTPSKVMGRVGSLHAQGDDLGGSGLIDHRD